MSLIFGFQGNNFKGSHINDWIFKYFCPDGIMLDYTNFYTK